MNVEQLVTLFEAGSQRRYGVMVDRARAAAEPDPPALLFALVSSCCDLADRLAAATGTPARDVLAEQATLVVRQFAPASRAVSSPAGSVRSERDD